MRVAAIDCGTNSIRLLVADISPDGTLADVVRRMEIVRLGQGVDSAGRLAPEALKRTFEACRDYADVVAREGVSRLRFVATSATRDAANRDEFTRGVSEILGVEPEVVSGDEEAALAYAGATRELAGQPEPFLVVDIGGGSTEFVLGSRTPRAARSVDIGCVRITERLLHSDPPSSAEIAAATAEIDAQIEVAASTVPLEEASTIVGLAGSVTTVAATVLDLPAYDSSIIHRSVLPVGSVHAATRRLLAMTHEERAALPFMHPGRVDVIGAGALILDRVMVRTGRPEVLVSEHDILDGIAYRLADI